MKCGHELCGLIFNGPILGLILSSLSFTLDNMGIYICMLLGINLSLDLLCLFCFYRYHLPLKLLQVFN